VNPADVDALLAAKFNDTQTVSDALTEKIATIGENMNIRRFTRYEGINGVYVHGGGRIGILVNFKLGDESKASSDAFGQLAKDVAMQISVMSPQYVNRDEVEADTLEKEKEILRAKATNEGKPAEIIEKMLIGQVQKFYKEICLVDQEYIKDEKMSVGQYMKDVAASIGTTIDIAREEGRRLRGGSRENDRTVKTIPQNFIEILGYLISDSKIAEQSRQVYVIRQQHEQQRVDEQRLVVVFVLKHYENERYNQNVLRFEKSQHLFCIRVIHSLRNEGEYWVAGGFLFFGLAFWRFLFEQTPVTLRRATPFSADGGGLPSRRVGLGLRGVGFKYAARQGCRALRTGGP
jgi:elongation factor Ts